MLLAGLGACSVQLASTGPGIEVDDAAVTVPVEPLDATLPQDRDATLSDDDDDDAQASGDDDAQQAAHEAGAADVGTVTEVDGSGLGPRCTLDGRFALRVQFDVTWAASEIASTVPIVDSGEGKLSILALLELSSTASGLGVSFRECAEAVPEFASALTRERYLMRFADATWDAASMPTFSSTASAACSDPGCTITVQPIYALIGAALSAPTAAWPAEANLGQWPDHDADEAPGITAHMLGPLEGQYAYPVLEVRENRRMRDVALGQRVVLGLGGTLESCDAFRGKTKASSIETRAVACRAVTPPFACSGSDLRFLNNNLPVWSVREGQFDAKRVAPTADCAKARQVFGGATP